MGAGVRRIATPLAGVWVVENEATADPRGAFRRLFCAHELGDLLAGEHIVQINHSLTRRTGSIRGLHYQHPPMAEIKLVRCLRGEVHDVVVDLRRGSPTFLQSFATRLTHVDARMLVVPAGLAHGFQTLTDDCELLYLHTHVYSPSHEGGLRWDDPRLGIRWPMPPTELSSRDRSHALLDEAFEGLAL